MTAEQTHTTKTASLILSDDYIPQNVKYLVTGFIKPIEALILHNIIPTSIANLILDFYFSLKLTPDSPFDISSTNKDFTNVSSTFMLKHNNPKHLFEILKTICMKLKLPNPKYRIIDTMNSIAQNKLFKFDGAKDFLTLLGFEHNNQDFMLRLPSKQPPLSVLESAIDVCNHFLLECNQRPSVIDTIKKFSLTSYKNKLRKNRTSNTIQLHITENEDVESLLKDKLQTFFTDEPQFEINMEDNGDRFQLLDIIWSITHQNSSSTDPQRIILLLFPLFTDSITLLECLVIRFFASEVNKSDLIVSYYLRQVESLIAVMIPNNVKQFIYELCDTSTNISINNNIYCIESSLQVQKKVILFIQQWMKTYWNEDWNENEKILDFMEQFSNKIEIVYKNDPNMNDENVADAMKLIGLLYQTMQFEVAKCRKVKNEILTVNTALTSPDFMKMNNKHLAEQITLLDFKCYSSIKKRECLGGWKKQNKQKLAPNILALIDDFNRVGKWIQCTILLASNVKNRGRLIKKFIKIENELFLLKNFQSLRAFHGALSSVPIYRLKHAWSFVPAKHIKRFEEMKTIFITKNGMANLRKLHREAHGPFVPYCGIFLTDLVSVIGHEKKWQDDFVNFAFLMRLSDIIDDALSHKQTRYDIKEDFAVKTFLLQEFERDKKVDLEYLYEMSLKLVKKDKSVKKRAIFSLFGSK